MASNSTNGRDQNNGPQSRSQDYDGSQVHVQNKPIGSAESLSCSEPSTSLPRCRGRPRVKPLTYGPKNKCGRPRKDTNEVSQQRPRKKAREHSPGVTISFGKFTLPPGFRLQNVTRLSGSKSKPREEPAEQSQQQQPAESTVNGIPPPPAPQYPHHILVEEEDPNREVDDLNDEDLEVDGIGIGVDEGIYGNEDNIGDDDTDDTGGVALEDREENIHRPSCIPCWPLPRWLMEPFEAAIEESKRRDNHGLPPLYQKSTFWFPTPAPYFLFRLCAHLYTEYLVHDANYHSIGTHTSAIRVAVLTSIQHSGLSDIATAADTVLILELAARRLPIEAGTPVSWNLCRLSWQPSFLHA
ncbi:hypothetical protein Agabi119p4_2437 [Agaricus bisporus var. burnettii]|uniref:Uncharacterized protein n=1 Tax=Agaricus bisporus var. burnettii TaxID=192524 RepID=A0A8H7KK46_AGABI|nr:hypothetical protein Agabi119p4_2437 [Agaricus bisporus var. burnettii]